ncbi:MAG: two-component system, cell cycle response regulator [Gaiellales bacterium]|nr:two-component system, cell cycle response regulator [Gaiellales bacterium]
MPEHLAADTEVMARSVDEGDSRPTARAAAARSSLAAPDWWLAAAVGALEDHVYFGLLRLDGSYQELFVGPNLERLLGGEPQSSAHWRSRIDPDDLAAYRACEGELLAGRPAQVDYRVHGLDGTTRWIRARVNPEQLADGTVRFAGILSDVTQQHETEDDLRAALAALAEANAKLDAAHSRAVELAKTDPLTGAANRRHVDEVLSELLAGGESSVGVLLLDIDDFKNDNDQFGHRVGDEVLIEIVERLERAVRPEDVVARWGGEEFLLVCQAEQGESVRTVAERVLAAISEQLFRTTVGELAITVSVGAVASHGLAHSPDALVDAADAALLAAKRAGKNRIVVARRPPSARVAA